MKAIAEKILELLKPYLMGKKNEADEVLDVQGLAEYLKVSTKWIYERTHLKIDGKLLFRRKDINKWLNSHNVPTVDDSKRIVPGLK